MTLTREDLIRRFREYESPRERWLVGGEFERITLRSDGGPVPYAGDGGVRWILESLAERHGWETIFEGENPIALARRGASTTLEPGGQVELSGAPYASLVDLAREARETMQELQNLSREADLQWTALGLTPYAPIQQVDWMPKGRYRVMREYLPQRGDLALAMMKGTSCFQANFDYSDEEDCAEKLSVLARLGAVTTALFANSPIFEGKETGWLSFRGHIWTRTDPDRTGFPLIQGYTHEAWVDYLLDVPMMFYKREGAWTPAMGRTFREYMDQGIQGHFPSMGDWDLHQTSVFPEVRVKRTIEIRGADAVPLPLALGGIAFWTGLIYDPEALSQAGELAREFDKCAPPQERFLTACQSGLGGRLGGRTLTEWAREAGQISAAGLRRYQPESASLIEPVLAQIESGESPAVAALRAWREDPSPARFLPRVAY